MAITDSIHHLDDAEIEINPLDAAVAALFRATSPQSFSAACDALANAADAGDEAFLVVVDRAQNLAVATGLVEDIGEDNVQQIMARAFRRCGVHHDVHQPEQPFHRRAPESTLEALMLDLRQRGAAALTERDSLRRLDELSRQQVREIITRLIKLRPRYPKISDELLFKLGGLL